MQEPRVVHVPLTVMGPRGVNAYLIIGDRPVIVDTGIPGMADQIVAALDSEGWAPDDVSLIVLTHAHIDHAGSLAELVRRTGAPVLAQRADAAALGRGTSEPAIALTEAVRLMVERMAAGSEVTFESVQADIVVDEGYSLDAYGVAGRVFHVPGHTAGGLAIALDGGEIVAGDVIGGDADGNAAFPPFGVNEDELRVTIGRILDLEPSRLYCGHAGPFEAAAALRKLRETLRG